MLNFFKLDYIFVFILLHAFWIWIGKSVLMENKDLFAKALHGTVDIMVYSVRKEHGFHCIWGWHLNSIKVMPSIFNWDRQL